MTVGLQIFDSSGNLTFDSNTATGGVCLGIYTVTSGVAATFTFPDIGAGHSGFVVDTLAGSVGPWTYDESLGYPRFSFGNNNWGGTFLLFVR